MSDRPTVGTLEQRSAQDAAVTVEGRKLRGLIPFGIESRDLGGWREVMSPGCLDGADLSDLVATVDHGGIPLGRYPDTLEVERDGEALRWAVEVPEARADVLDAVERKVLRSGSWRMVVKRDEWRGEVRHVHEVGALRDVALVTSPAYPSAVAELRQASEDPAPSISDPEPTPEEATMADETTTAGGLVIEDRAADENNLESRVVEALRSVNPGEARSLNTVNASAVTPEEQGTFLFDRLRATSVALAAGIRVVPTSRESIVWPRIVSDIDPTWVAEEEVIPEGDPAFGTLTATPKKLAHRVELSNEVIDDSEPSIVDVLNGHLATMLGLKLDRSIFESNPSDPDAIRGLKYVAGIQTVSLGTNGAPMTDYDPLLEAVGLLRAANVAPPYVAVVNPRTLTALSLLKEAAGSNVALQAPDGIPAIYSTSQASVAETKGTATNASSAYVFAPAEVILVRRYDAVIELDRSRLFDRDMSEMRAKMRCDLIVPNPQAVVRVEGITPA